MRSILSPLTQTTVSETRSARSSSCRDMSTARFFYRTMVFRIVSSSSL